MGEGICLSARLRLLVRHHVSTPVYGGSVHQQRVVMGVFRTRGHRSRAMDQWTFSCSPICLACLVARNLAPSASIRFGMLLLDE